MANVARPSLRQRAREQMTEQIKQAARTRLAADGANLSLRAVARDLGVVSSAVYRYFASRDELLTALIVDAYDDLAAAVEQAEALVSRRDLLGRWRSIGHAIRDWAIAHPHEYALTYGSPVPGYRAPGETIAPANRPLWVLAALLRDGWDSGALTAPPGDRLSRGVRVDLTGLATTPQLAGLPATLLGRAFIAWTELFGAVSFEMFGRLQNTITDQRAYFDYQLRAMAGFLGLSG